jgi:uncharacterized membrane protein
MKSSIMLALLITHSYVSHLTRMHLVFSVYPFFLSSFMTYLLLHVLYVGTDFTSEECNLIFVVLTTDLIMAISSS